MNNKNKIFHIENFNEINDIFKISLISHKIYDYVHTAYLVEFYCNKCYECSLSQICSNPRCREGSSRSCSKCNIKMQM